MSDLYRSAIGARMAKLSIMHSSAHEVHGGDDDADEEAEAQNSVGELPVAGYSGMGPPAMQVELIFEFRNAFLI